MTVSGKFEGDPPTISGGPLGDSSYKFSQLHFHWGPGDEEGSEHTFEGRRWASIASMAVLTLLTRPVSAG